MLNPASDPPEALAMNGVSSGGDAERMVINVGGVRHETHKSTLASIPGTRLANLLNATTKEVFFDRHAGAFAHVLNFYRTGKLHCPPDVCGALFEEELGFWGLGEAEVEPCCWENFRRHRVTEEALAQIAPDEPPPDYSAHGPEAGGAQMGRREWMQKMWTLFDDPHSSVAAMAIGVVSFLFLLVAITSFCVGTLPKYNLHDMDFQSPDYTDPDSFNATIYAPDTENPSHMGFVWTEVICVMWFTFEFLVRIICCPNKCKFLKNILNIIDFVSILPLYLELFVYGTPLVEHMTPFWLLRVVRFFRILLVFKILPMTTTFEALGLAVVASVYDIFLLILSLMVSLLTLAALILYVEAGDSVFKNIFMAAWWAVVTLSTVGYGDMYPESWKGMLVASVCALIGILTIAMPIVVLVHRFTRFQALVEAKHRRPGQRRAAGDGRAGGSNGPPVWGLVYRSEGEASNGNGGATEMEMKEGSHS